MPFLFVCNYTLIMIGAPAEIALDIGTAAIGATVLVSGFMRQFITKANVFKDAHSYGLGNESVT